MSAALGMMFAMVTAVVLALVIVIIVIMVVAMTAMLAAPIVKKSQANSGRPVGCGNGRRRDGGGEARKASRRHQQRGDGKNSFRHSLGSRFAMRAKSRPRLTAT
ncbi:hypothetical protein M2323_003832 [Rhodoblastus acidophilus]|uniref:hypothetical protein n=1 Tax=Rhodoblastus acidophilus TaxID=1074 RepID=UPI00222517D4|nr:hypothetical protein [Rhodoblastus acidophilus]MCW2285995.1 hypothetical protein [Rhodoblastus acidophilus]MCW2334889.1 hypothetical protein [Rhodoblastus acidophilus]